MKGNDPKQRPWVALAVILPTHIALARWTWRDLASRTDDEVRGPRRIWRIASALNTTGSVGYFLFGRLPRRAELQDALIRKEFARP
ncbi:MAG TPA: hypothetical protein VNG12_10320 [Acidimicrobiales bacterium]|nr:hypothetical protein [Acidimicrobiales bacterium]